MADLKFGVGQFGKPTPVWMKTIFKTLLYVSGLWAIIIPLATNLSHALITEVDHWCVIGLAVMRFTISFFHYDFSETDV